MSDLFERLGRFAARRRFALIAAYLALSVLFAWLGSSIRFETRLTELLPRGVASADDLRDLLESEGTIDRLLISVERREGSELEEAASALTAALRATGLFEDVRYGVEEEEILQTAAFAVEHLPVLISPDRAAEAAERLRPDAIRRAIASIRNRAAMPGFSGVVKDLAARDPLGLLPLVSAGIEAVPEIARPDPMTGLFLSPDGRRLLIVGRPVLPPTEIDFSRRLIDAVERAEEEVRASLPGGGRLRFDHAGGHLVALLDERRIRHDAAATSLFSLAGIALIYIFVIRRPALWVAVLVPIVMSTVWTLGLAAVYPGRLNLITVAFAAILLGIGDDAMIHIYLREREERRAGLPPGASVAAAMRSTGPAVTVATLTTAVAFASLGFVRFRGLAELGVIAAMGMTTLLAGVFFFFPAALAYLAARGETAPSPALRLPLGGLLAVHGWCARRRRTVLAVTAALTLVLLIAASGLQVSSDIRSIRGEDPAAAALARVLQPFGRAAGAEPLVVIHGSRSGHAGAAPGRERIGGSDAPPRPGAAASADVERGLEQAAALDPLCREWARTGRTVGCDNPAAWMPPGRIQRERFEALSAALAGGASGAWTPGPGGGQKAPISWSTVASAVETEARAAGMNSTFFAPFLKAVRGHHDFDAVRIPLDASRFGALGVPVTRIYAADQDDLPRIAEAIRSRLGGPPVRIASVALVGADLSRIISEDFERAAWLVALAVVLLIAVSFRGARRSFLTLAPLALGTIWMLGALRLAGVELNLMSLMAMPIVLGLGVDYGVYIVDRWMREGLDATGALRSVGPAVLITGLTTVAGFGALLGAELEGLRTLGLAVVLGTGCTLLAALLVLPLLLPSRDQVAGGELRAPRASGPL